MLGLKQWLIHYCHDVINGEIIACQKHKWACERFLRDIERAGTDAFPYVFDEDKALRFFEWMSLFRHTKGVLRGERIQPHEIQVFVFGNIYGWVHKDTGYRRFRKAYWQVGRKNAKSQSLACVASYEAMALGEGMSEVYIGATKTEQAKIVYNETKAMLNACPELHGKFKEAYGRITHLRTDSIIRPLSKEDKKTGDGLNPQAAIIDEYHAHDTDEVYNVLDSGMVARPQPLLMVITTAGDTSGPCYRVEYDYVSRLLNPNEPTENEQYFVMVNELDKDDDGNLIDDIQDERAWLKANPIAASYPEGLANIRARLAEALEKPEAMDDFLTKNMNVWISTGENKYLRAEKWTACGRSETELPDVRGHEVFVGIDLSSKIDLTSVTFEIPLGDDSYLVLSHSFMPEDTLKHKQNTDKVPYALWARQGWITVTPGAAVDYKFVEKYIVDQLDKNGWILKELCFDPWNATQFAQEFDAKGYTAVEIRQGYRTLSEPIKHFREMVLEKKIIHDRNPVLAWAVSNAVTRQDHNQNLMLDKDKSTDRIDPLAATINAHSRAMFMKTIDVSEFSRDDFLKKLWG
ncbi:terminase large subunit [Brevibacillus borstelensis]|uniref:terminase large subunit n=1 Tax=Brevibacillus borstelensis TaxID=45462 RepID=UPI00057BFF0A|nr:terminase TerL endonuclease subunit [Brevibacillus borstelensis]MED1881076.1 terminase large subunit [Brevibacillus borstelensis]MED2006709.1 terminase large subunit [Brevibacillus borstelensis]RNB66394.1 terminase large subunit [Brevibacillus borstelensis]GED53529.1 terminase [Brevibacillus borstelensis]